MYKTIRWKNAHRHVKGDLTLVAIYDTIQRDVLRGITFLPRLDVNNVPTYASFSRPGYSDNDLQVIMEAFDRRANKDAYVEALRSINVHSSILSKDILKEKAPAIPSGLLMTFYIDRANTRFTLRIGKDRTAITTPLRTITSSHKNMIHMYRLYTKHGLRDYRVKYQHIRSGLLARYKIPTDVAVPLHRQYDAIELVDDTDTKVAQENPQTVDEIMDDINSERTQAAAEGGFAPPSDLDPGDIVPHPEMLDKERKLDRVAVLDDRDSPSSLLKEAIVAMEDEDVGTYCLSAEEVGTYLVDTPYKSEFTDTTVDDLFYRDEPKSPVHKPSALDVKVFNVELNMRYDEMEDTIEHVHKCSAVCDRAYQKAIVPYINNMCTAYAFRV